MNNKNKNRNNYKNNFLIPKVVEMLPLDDWSFANTNGGLELTYSIDGRDKRVVINPKNNLCKVATITPIGTTTATLNITLDKFGSFFYVVVLATQIAPKTFQILAGQDSLNNPAILSGKVVAMEDEAKSVNFTGLTSLIAYKVYIVPRGVLQNNGKIKELSFTTT